MLNSASLGQPAPYATRPPACPGVNDRANNALPGSLPSSMSSGSTSPPSPLLSPIGPRIANEASQFWNLSSESGPDRGNLACAYMVNKILERTIGHRYGLDPDTVNSVRTDLLRSGGKIIPVAQAQPGDLALSYNAASLRDIGGATAHIGIFITPSLIIANSSSNRRFNQILSPHEFSKIYPYFEVIRTPEAMQPAHTFLYLA